MGLGKYFNPHLWASLKPLGLGQQRPNNYMELVHAGWANRDRAGYAWRILNEDGRGDVHQKSRARFRARREEALCDVGLAN